MKGLVGLSGKCFSVSAYASFAQVQCLISSVCRYEMPFKKMKLASVHPQNLPRIALNPSLLMTSRTSMTIRWRLVACVFDKIEVMHIPTTTVLSKQGNNINFSDGDMDTIVTTHHARRRRMSYVRPTPKEEVRHHDLLDP